jgi:hypothetical protein
MICEETLKTSQQEEPLKGPGKRTLVVKWFGRNNSVFTYNNYGATPNNYHTIYVSVHGA